MRLLASRSTSVAKITQISDYHNELVKLNSRNIISKNKQPLEQQQQSSQILEHSPPVSTKICTSDNLQQRVSTSETLGDYDKSIVSNFVSPMTTATVTSATSSTSPSQSSVVNSVPSNQESRRASRFSVSLVSEQQTNSVPIENLSSNSINNNDHLCSVTDVGIILPECQASAAITDDNVDDTNNIVTGKRAVDAKLAINIVPAHELSEENSNTVNTPTQEQSTKRFPSEEGENSTSAITSTTELLQLKQISDCNNFEVIKQTKEELLSLAATNPAMLPTILQSDIKHNLDTVQNHLCNIRLETNQRQNLLLLLQRQYIEEEELRLKHYIELEKFKKNLPKPVMCPPQNLTSLLLTNAQSELQQSPGQQTNQFYQWQCLAAIRQQQQQPQTSVGMQNCPFTTNVLSPLSQQPQQNQQQSHQSLIHQDQQPSHHLEQMQQSHQSCQQSQELKNNRSTDQEDTQNSSTTLSTARNQKIHSIPHSQEHLITSKDNNEIMSPGSLKQIETSNPNIYHQQLTTQPQIRETKQQNLNMQTLPLLTTYVSSLLNTSISNSTNVPCPTGLTESSQQLAVGEIHAHLQVDLLVDSSEENTQKRKQEIQKSQLQQLYQQHQQDNNTESLSNPNEQHQPTLLSQSSSFTTSSTPITSVTTTNVVDAEEITSASSTAIAPLSASSSS